MSYKTLEAFFNQLIPELWTDFIFFILDKDIPNDLMENFKQLDRQKVFNKVLVVDYYKGPMSYEKGRDNKKALLKGSSLDKNIFKLLEKKSDAEPQAFNYVLEKYFEQVECLFYLSNWMNNNLQHIKVKDKTALGLFQIQYTYYKKHFEALIKQFYPNKNSIPQGNFNAFKLIETYFPNIIKQYNNNEKPITSPSGILIQKKLVTNEDPKDNKGGVNVVAISSKILSNKVKKSPIITEMEAENILLKAVFNLNIEC